MGNVLGCGGERSRPQNALKTQKRIQDLMSVISLQEFEKKLKKYSGLNGNGSITGRQLAEMLGFHQVQTKNNTLLADILMNPYFYYKPVKEESQFDIKSESSVLSMFNQPDFIQYNRAQKEELLKLKPIADRARQGLPPGNPFARADDFFGQDEERAEGTGIQAKKDQLFDVEKILLFALLYTPSTLDKAAGNQAKALVFYYLVCDKLDPVQNLSRDNLKVKQNMLSIFEMCQAHLEADFDGH